MRIQVLVLLLLFNQVVHAAAKTWTGNTSTAWGTATNWSGNSLPASGDDITIPTSPTGGRMPTISASYTVKSITIQAGATLTHTGGTLTVSGGDLYVSGTYSISGGTFLSNQDITIASGGSVDHSGGTVHMSTSTGTTPTDDISINANGNYTLSSTGILETRDFISSSGSPNGTFTQSGGTIEVNHDFKNSGTFTASAGTIIFANDAGGGGFPSTVTSANTQFHNVQIDSGVDPAFDNNAISFNVSGDWANNSSSVTLTGSATTVIFNGSGTQTIGGTVSTTFRNLTIDKSTGTAILTRNQTVTSGNLSINGGTLDLDTYTLNRSSSGGTLTVSNGCSLLLGADTGGQSGSNFPTNFSSVSLGTTSTIEYDGSNAIAQRIYGGVTYGHVTLTNSSGSGSANKYTTSNLTINGNLTINSLAELEPGASNTVGGTGTLTGSGTAFVTRTTATADLNNQYTISNKTFSSLTVDYFATGAQTVNAYNYYNLTISGSRSTNSVTLAGSGTIGVSGTFSPSASFTSGNYVITGSTIDFNGTIAQSVPAFNYNHLTISGARTSNSVTLANSGTIGIAGTFTASASFSSGSYVITGSTVNYNATAAQTVTAFNYNHLTLSGSRTTNSITLAGSGTIGVAGTFTASASFTSGNYIITGSTIDYNATSAQTVTAFNYHHLTLSGARTTNSVTLASSGTIGIAGTFTASASFTSGNYIITGSTIDYNATTAQSVAAFNYNNITISGARTTNSVTLASSGTIGVAGTFTASASFTSGNYVITGSTVNYNATAAQTVTAFNYHHLTLSGSRTTNSITLASSGTIGVAGTFTASASFTSGNYVITGSTVNYNATAAQTVTAFNYNHLTISGSRTTNSITLASSGTIGVAGTFTASATFSSGAYVITGSTVNYNATTSQTVTAFNYNHLTLSGARTTNSITLASSGTIAVAGTFTASASFTSGNYVLTGSTVDFNGSSAQNIPAYTFNNLTVSGGGAKTATGAVVVNSAFVLSSTILTTTASNLLTIKDNGTTSGASLTAYVSGPVKKIGDDAFTFPVGKSGTGYMPVGISAPSVTTDAFTAEYMRSSATGMGSISAVGLFRVSNCDYWQLDRTTGSSSVNVTLSWNGYSNCNAAAYVSDLATLAIAHYNGTTWNTYGRNSSTGNASSGTVTWNGVSAFSPFALGSTSDYTNPLRVGFTALNAYQQTAGVRLEFSNLSESDIAFYEVERSVNNGAFAVSAQIPATVNNGGRADYHWLDQQPAVENVLYRIKATGTDGKTGYSSTVKISQASSQGIEIYPNPVTDGKLVLHTRGIKAGAYEAAIVDMNGRIIRSQALNLPGAAATSQTLLLPPGLKPGVYNLRISGPSLQVSKTFMAE